MRRNLIESCIHIALLVPISVAASLSSTSSIIIPPIQSVTVIGGVHGNEYTGVWCVKALEQRIQSSSTEFRDKYASLDISTLIGNPEAHVSNQRFVDTDLNRLFTREALTSAATSMEGHRAKEIDQLVGPKFGEAKSTSTDCIIDLHSTTANMGLTLIFPEGDVLMARACAYAMHKCNASASANKKITRILFEGRSSRQEDPFLISCAPHGFTIEVGPVPQGVLRHDAVLSTDEALEAALEYLQMHNTQPENALEKLNECYKDGMVPCFFYEDKIPWPSDPENPNFPAYLVHESIQDRDFCSIEKGDPLFVDLDGNVVVYDGKFGSPVSLIFVNEGGYYYSSSGTGIGVASPSKFCLETGRLLE